LKAAQAQKQKEQQAAKLRRQANTETFWAKPEREPWSMKGHKQNCTRLNVSRVLFPTKTTSQLFTEHFVHLSELAFADCLVTIKAGQEHEAGYHARRAFQQARNSVKHQW